MPLFFIIWLSICGFAGLVWLSRHLGLSRANREQETLTPSTYDTPPRSAPRLSVLVAGKDEEDNIGECVATFLDQDYPDYELIVIDDRSTDRTPQILRRLQDTSGSRLKVLTVKQLRDGWFGKNNAMREGVATSDGEWLCFADADCTQRSRRTLSAAVQCALEKGVDMLSVLPVLETRSFWERIVQPVCAAILLFWFHPKRVNNPSSSTAYANGAFLLMKRSAYQRIGGHERVKTEVNEDIHLARLTKQAGLRLHVIRNNGLYTTRMYSSFGQMWRGWGRIFYGCLGSVRRILLALLLLTTFSIFPWLSLLGATIGVLTAGPDSVELWRMMLAVSSGVVIAEQTVMARFYRLTHVAPVWSLFYIGGALLGLGMLINALAKAAGATTTTWRGTTYRGHSLEPSQESQPTERPSAARSAV